MTTHARSEARRVLVCGGRDYSDALALFRVLDEMHMRERIGTIIHGAARGADTLAGEWALSRGVQARAFPADWQQFGRSAGPRRNAQMLAEGEPDMVVTFPGGRGTANMVKQAERAGVPVYRV